MWSSLPRLGAMCLGFVLVTTVGAGATSYDAAADFSASSNPGGVWSYRAGSSGEPLLTVTGTAGSPSLPDWYNANASFPGVVTEVDNNTGTDMTNPCCTSILYHAHTLSLDGQSIGSIVRFTAAFAGIYSVSGLFESNDTSMATHNVGVVENGTTTLLTQSLVNGNTVGISLSSLALNAGSYLDFISYGFSGGSYGSTGLQAVVTTASSPPTTVPEPASLLLLAAGLLGLAAAARHGRAYR